MRVGGSTLVALMVVGVFALGVTASFADVMAFQQGVSPDAGYQQGATYVTTREPDRNYNGSSTYSLLVTNGQWYYGDIHSLLEFDISDIPAGATINNVSLAVRNRYQEDAGDSITVIVGLLPESFDETTVTWNSLTPAGGDITGSALSSLTFDPSPPADETITFASTADFVSAAQSALDGDGQLCMILHSAEPSTSNIARFYNNESGAPSEHRPALVVDYTPVPEPVTLILAGCGGVGLVRRRRHG